MPSILVGSQFRDLEPRLPGQIFEEGRFYQVFDVDRCIRCHKCEIACKIANDMGPGVRALRIVHIGYVGESGQWKVLNIPFNCLQCEQPECVYMCPTGALQKTPQGIVQDTDLCIGCRMCEVGCPHAMISYDFELELTRKCDFCPGEQGKDFLPPCAESCLVDALVFKKGDDLRAFLEKKERKGAGFIMIMR